MTTFEQAARRAWLRDSDWRFAKCGKCGRLRDENDHPLLVARQPRHRKFECLSCFDGTHVQGVVR